jgi:hypothetical protein
VTAIESLGKLNAKEVLAELRPLLKDNDRSHSVVYPSPRRINYTGTEHRTKDRLII